MGNSVLIKKGNHINLFQTKSGWEFVSRHEVPRIDGNVLLDAVIIVPIVKTYEGLKLLITREWREPLQEWTWGFPAGLVDPQESPYTTAVRELKEETGLDVVGKVLKWSARLFSSEGMTDESVKVCYVFAEGDLTKIHQQDGEKINHFLVDYKGAQAISAGFEYEAVGKVAYFIIEDFAKTGFDWLFERRV